LQRERLVKTPSAILLGVEKFRRVMGLNQISWLPLPWRTKVQPAARNDSRNGRSNCGAIMR
jgi:hypothetical protein